MNAAIVATAALAMALAGGCVEAQPPDPGLIGLAVASAEPATIVPGTQLHVTGASFIAASWGETTLHLHGDGAAGAVDVDWPAQVVDFADLTVAVDADMLAALGAGEFRGTIAVEVTAVSDGRTYASAPLAVAWQLAAQLTPSVQTVMTGGAAFANDPIAVDGGGFLLGGAEGTTYARVTGCLAASADADCAPIAPVELPLAPRVAGSRTEAELSLSPAIVGIRSGQFTGSVQVIDRQPGQPDAAAPPIAVAYTLVSAQIFALDPPAASLGQYVFVRGAGFVGGEAGALTVLHAAGTFAPTGGASVPVDLTLVPEVVDGQLARYPLNVDDALGHAIDLRATTGAFTGTLTPITSYRGDQVTGQGVATTFAIAPVQQVVYLHFDSSFIEELRDFGLRAVDASVRAQVVAAVRAAYPAVNIDVRTEPVTDFAQFSDVELVAVDPNGMDLFGYDNTPGKDSGNLRLDDELGGANAAVQQDGYPGYGGVFLRSFMGFSPNPGAFGPRLDGADPAFDQIFDSLRPDRGGRAVDAADLAADPPAQLVDSRACPARDRGGEIACGAFVLGHLVGDTVAHEVGHSLGLAYPYAAEVHDHGDRANRLMDAGDARPFRERAALLGAGPSVFCADEYVYLRSILPSAQPPDPSPRPPCD